MKSKKILINLSLIIAVSSCATLKKSMITSGLSLGFAGATGGYIFSPTKEDQSKNAFVFGLLGAFVGVGASYLLYDKPLNQKQLNPMIIDKEKRKESINLFNFSPDLKNLSTKIDFKPVDKYEVPIKKLPPKLVGKVKKQYLIEYKSPPKTIQYKGRTIAIDGFKAWEHVYE